MQDFIHLHVHTQYSILDGQASIPNLLRKAMNDGMRGMAVTDHGNMMGIKEFFNESAKLIGTARKEVKALSEVPEGETEAGRAEREKKLAAARLRADFKPIFGCEMYCARRGMARKEEREDQSGWHLIVLAKNEKGYHNLIKLVSNAWVDGFYMRPRTDHEQLEKYHEGLIVCSACIAGEVPSKILKGDLEGAEEAVQWFKRVFGDDYYLELQRHKVTDPGQRANRETFPLQEKANAVLRELAARHGVKLVCTNDVHFVDEENAEAHDRLICLSTGKDLDDPTRMLYTKQEWFKTQAEMNRLFADVPEALAGTMDVLSKIETYSIDHAPIMPNFDIPAEFGTEEEYRQRITHEELFNEFTRDENGNVVMSEEEGRKKIEKLGGFDKLYRIKFEADYLAKLAYEGAAHRYGTPLPKDVDDRIRFELHVMKTMGFPGYFLIVQDYINTARDKLGVSVGPGRGSAAGSCVAYCLGITQIDPIEYDLLFERFLNPDRISLPDIDVDFDDDGRGRVLDWVTKKYGEENCAHIITYGTMATKMALKDVARVQKLPLQESNRLCKLIPDRLPEGPDGRVPKMNLANAIAAVPELKMAEASPDPVVRDTFRYAKMLEGNVRNTGVHACGFIICKDKISDWVPVSTADDKETGGKLHCTQYEGKVIEETGLIKMDFLGLKNLSIIKEALENIRLSLGVELDIDAIPTDDDATYRLFSDGNTIGTFQFESAGMQKHLRDLQPNCLGDLIAMNALYRPGPMQYIPQFIKRKKGEEPITYDLPCMERYLKDTYGITVYQEQVMLLSREIADFTRGESDTLRKAMGKKMKDKLDHMYPKFIEGGKKNGHDPKTLEKIWKDWEAFASYAFNKSHAACYAWIAYQTGYLKANYPAQFMAGTLSRNLANITEITKCMDECRQMGIRTLGPDINESLLKFSVNSKGDIRFGLGGIKGVGTAAVEHILAERAANGPFKDIYDVFERINFSLCNRKTIENMILAGVFDSLLPQRVAFFSPYAPGSSDSFLDQLMRYGVQYQTDKQMAMNSLFGDFGAIEIFKPSAPTEVLQWSEMETLNREREVIGIYISGHPLDRYKVILQRGCSMKATDLDNLAPFIRHEVTLGGIVSNVREGQTRNGTPFGIVRIEDYNGSGELALFGTAWAKWRGHLMMGNAVYIHGRVDAREYSPDRVNFNITNVEFLPEICDSYVRKLTISTRLDLLDERAVSELCTLLTEQKGETEVLLHVKDLEDNMNVNLRARKMRIQMTSRLYDFLENNEAFNFHIN
ncbi:MAG: DNA polymerase III subunit alpha [Alloprevotella sp.]|nr:DNA polymerase III subunit alpha [Alloprevotella sp.]